MLKKEINNLGKKLTIQQIDIDRQSDLRDTIRSLELQLKRHHNNVEANFRINSASSRIKDSYKKFPLIEKRQSLPKIIDHLPFPQTEVGSANLQFGTPMQSLNSRGSTSKKKSKFKNKKLSHRASRNSMIQNDNFDSSMGIRSVALRHEQLDTPVIDKKMVKLHQKSNFPVNTPNPKNQFQAEMYS